MVIVKYTEKCVLKYMNAGNIIYCLFAGVDVSMLLFDLACIKETYFQIPHRVIVLAGVMHA